MARTYKRDAKGRFAATGATKAKPASGAPKRLKFENAYHGTSIEAGAAIRRGGYRESSDGNLGPGVYATRKRKEARQYSRIAESPGVGDKPGAVLRHRIPKGRGVTVGTGPGIWSQGYEAAQAAKGRGQIVRAKGGDMDSVLLLSKAQADRSLVKPNSTVRRRRRRK